MTENEALPPKLPPYVGTGPKDRVRALLEAVAATRGDRVRDELEPAGLLGWPGKDGYYHELTEADLRALIGDGDGAPADMVRITRQDDGPALLAITTAGGATMEIEIQRHDTARAAGWLVTGDYA